MTSTSVTVLGLGPMGRGLSSALLAAGVPTTVWNRSEAKAKDIVANGAIWASSPADAVDARDLTLINVVDHAVVDEILTAAGTAVAGRTVVGLSSDTPDRARHTARLVHGLGGEYLDGAIMTPTPTIGTASASILIAGPKASYDRHAGVLAALGATTWLGEDHGRAASYDMALLDLFWTGVGGFLHALKVAGANGIEPGDLLPHALGIVEILPAVFTEIAERIRDDRHDDSDAPVASVAASLRHIVAASRDAGLEAAALEAFRRQADAAVDEGYGGDEITRVFGFL